MRYVKLFNVVAGVLLVVGTLVLVGALVVKSSSDDEAEVATMPAPAPASGDLPQTLEIPAGSRILESDLDDGQLILLVEPPQGGRIVYVVDLATAAVRELRVEER